MPLPWTALRYFDSIDTLTYKGTWDASGGTVPDATPDTGDYYKISTAGTYSGTTYAKNEYIGYDGSSWGKIPFSEFLNDILTDGRYIITKYDETSETPSANFEFLCHFNGPDGSSDFTDRSSNGYSIAASGDAQCGTTTKKFGRSGLSLDGTGDYLTVSAPPFNFGSDDFTIAAWVYFDVVTNTRMICCQETSDASGKAWKFFFDATDGLCFSYATAAGDWTDEINYAWSPDASTWYHVAVERSGDNLRLYVNGSVLGTYDCSGDTIVSSSENMIIGADAGGANLFDGVIDEMIVVSDDLWGGEFVPEDQPYYVEIGYQESSLYVVEANTAGSGSPNMLTAAEKGKVLTNEDATAKNYHTLHSASAGEGPLHFVVQDSDGIRIVANDGDTIRFGDTVTVTAGYAESTEIGATVTLFPINDTEWVALSFHGTWTLETS